jgi:lipopolysaccharide transport system permease protein
MTPILYSIASMPPFLRTLTRLNPIYHLVQSYRAILVAGVWPSAWGLVYVAVVAALLLFAGLAVFRAAKGYVEALV